MNFAHAPDFMVLRQGEGGDMGITAQIGVMAALHFGGKRFAATKGGLRR
jgi:hypothetical protein